MQLRQARCKALPCLYLHRPSQEGRDVLQKTNPVELKELANLIAVSFASPLASSEAGTRQVPRLTSCGSGAGNLSRTDTDADAADWKLLTSS